MNKVILLFYFISLSGLFLEEGDFENNGFVGGVHKSNNEVTLPIQTLYPNDFQSTKKYPLVLFLHGAGERGSDNEKQLVHGSKLFLDEKNREAFPAVVIFPQCPSEDYWSNVDIERNKETNKRTFTFGSGGEETTAMQSVLSLLDSMINLPFIDTDRVYVGGLSMGGMGTFEMLSRRPNVFAAAITICGGGNPESVKNYATKVPLWIFHGAQDDVVPPTYSQQMADAIQASGGRAKLTIYPEANHNSWDPTFAEPELFSWLFSQSKKN